jgi:hypothetical protein
MSNNSGVLELLSNAHAKSSYQGTKYYFKGDLCQRSTARNVASQLRIRTDIEGGLPFVTSDEDFKTVTQYLISHQIEGWWHYVSYEEFCEKKGEFYFNGKYLSRNDEILKVAEDLGIFLGKTEMNLLYATSKENYNIIISKLN